MDHFNSSPSAICLHLPLGIIAHEFRAYVPRSFRFPAEILAFLGDGAQWEEGEERNRQIISIIWVQREGDRWEGDQKKSKFDMSRAGPAMTEKENGRITEKKSSNDLEHYQLPVADAGTGHSELPDETGC
jgi:hypothetical protein